MNDKKMHEKNPERQAPYDLKSKREKKEKGSRFISRLWPYQRCHAMSVVFSFLKYMN